MIRIIQGGGKEREKTKFYLQQYRTKVRDKSSIILAFRLLN